MTVKELTEKYGLSPIALPDPEREVKGCYIGDLLSWVMGRAESDSAWITIMNNINTLAVASLSDVSLVILSEGVTLEADIKNTAEIKGVNVAGTGLSSFEIAVRISGDV